MDTKYETTTIRNPQPPTSILQKVANSLSDPDSALALSLAAAVPLLRQGRRLAARHPVIAIGLAGILLAGYIMNSKKAEETPETLH